MAASLSSSSNTPEQQESEQDQPMQHLVLIGGGHAHVQVIKALNAAARPKNLDVTLIDAQTAASYSGMVPGCIAGQYTTDETLIHIPPLAEWADMTFIHDRVVDIDFEEKLIYCRQRLGEPIEFDAVSIDIGSASRGLDKVPGAQQYTIPTRPIAQLVQKLDAARDELLEEQASSSSSSFQPPRLVVVGGGAAGIELSMAITTRWQTEGLDPHTTLLDTGTQLLPHESTQAREQLTTLLDEKKIVVRHECQVERVEEDCVVLTNGDEIPFSYCVWATGAGAHPLAQHLSQRRGLDTTHHGWIQVSPTFQTLQYPHVFAAGDCAEIQGLPNGPPPKAGVFAVRAGPVLIENLTRFLMNNGQQQQKDLIQYEPQQDYMKLLVCGNQQAFGMRFGMVLFGKWVFRMKDQIDQNFMELFRVDPNQKPEDTAYNTAQYDDMTERDDPLPSAEEAAALLQRQDDDVDFELAWAILRTMSQEEDYRRDILRIVIPERDTVEVVST